MVKVKPLQIIYWLRLGLGIVAAVVCTGYAMVDTRATISVFMNGMVIAMIIYLMSYYPIKNRFINKVEKPQKLLTMGIGIYFISWLVFWILLYSIIIS
ncbi:MAG: hypothetical protein ACUVT9_03070 [Candidatus Bathycorpusculaceae bacterium]